MASDWACRRVDKKVEGKANHDFTLLNYANLFKGLHQMRINSVLLNKVENE